MQQRNFQFVAIMLAGILSACVQKDLADDGSAQKTELVSPSSSEPLAELKTAIQEPSIRSDWFETMLHCGDSAFLRKPAEQQLMELQKNSAWNCERKETTLSCRPNALQQAFKAGINELTFTHRDDAHILSLSLKDADLPALRKEAARVWNRSFKPESNQLLLTSDGSISLVIEQNKSELSLSCAIAPDTRENIELPTGWQNNSVPSMGSTRFHLDKARAKQLKGDKLLSAIVNCEAEHWLSLTLSERQQLLEPEGVLCNGVSDERGQAIECGIPETFKSFGLPAQTIRLIDDGEQHHTQIDVLGDVNSLKNAIEKRTKKPMESYSGSSGRYIDRSDERFQFVIYPAEDKQRSQLVCRMWSDAALDVSAAPHRTPPTAPTAPANKTKYAKSGISGSIKYPDGSPPAMRICAIDRQTEHYRCIQTAQGQSTYRIDVLHEGGRYVVVAEFDQDGLRAAGHANSIRCVMAPCPQSELIEVELGLGEYKNGIDLKEFLAQRGDWPALPKND